MMGFPGIKHRPKVPSILQRPMRGLFEGYETRELVRWFLFALAIGVVAGLGATVFQFLLRSLSEFCFHHLAHYRPPEAGGEAPRAASPLTTAASTRTWLFLILPAAGGLVSGFLVYKFAPEAEGHGTDAVIDCFHRRQGRIRPVVPVIKLLASVFTIGTGGSAGREGPIAQIGAGFGSILGHRLKLTRNDIRLMVLIGTGAGIGAVFRAPLGGAIFAAGVLYRETDFEHEVLMPAFIASIIAYAVYLTSSGQPFGPIFTLQSSFVFSPLQLPMYLVLGLILVPVALFYIKVFYGFRNHFFRRLPIPRVLKPAVGGLLLGAIAYWYPAVLGSGYGWIQEAIDGNLTLRMMLTLALLKVVATSLTISSGGSGGVFAPSLVIGGMIGGVVGVALHQWNPVLFAHPSAFILVGMAAFFAAAAKVPIASLILVSEMTGGYALLVPAMLAIAVAYILSSKRVSIYEKQVTNRLESPAHRGDYVVDVLEDIHVKGVLQPHEKEATLSADAPLQQILEVFTTSRQTVFPVVDGDGKVLGVVPLDTLRAMPTDLLSANLIIAHDIMEAIDPVRPDDNLNVALQKLLSRGFEQIPVVDEDHRLAGILSRQELLSAYSHRIRELMRQ